METLAEALEAMSTMVLDPGVTDVWIEYPRREI